MTTSENIITRNETFEPNTTIEIRHQFSADLDSTIFLSFNEFMIRTLQLEGGDQDSVVFSTDRNMLVMQFCLQGSGSFADVKSKQAVDFSIGHYNIFSIPNGKFELFSATKGATLLTIFINEAFLLENLPSNYFEDLCYETGCFGPIFPRNLMVNAGVATVLKEIQECEFDLSLRRMYMKAKLLELLTLQLVQHKSARKVALKSSQLEKMERVRSLIDDDLGQSLSLSNLARLTGTNEQYLKKNFKLLYGQTVGGYMIASKMQKAKEMLLKGEKNVAEIAEAVGYKHATHFTTAFKKFFGHLPRLLKTKLLIGSYFSMGVELELLEMLIAV